MYQLHAWVFGFWGRVIFGRIFRVLGERMSFLFSIPQPSQGYRNEEKHSLKLYAHSCPLTWSPPTRVEELRSDQKSWPSENSVSNLVMAWGQPRRIIEARSGVTQKRKNLAPRRGLKKPKYWRITTYRPLWCGRPLTTDLKTNERREGVHHFFDLNMYILGSKVSNDQCPPVFRNRAASKMNSLYQEVCWNF